MNDNSEMEKLTFKSIGNKNNMPIIIIPEIGRGIEDFNNLAEDLTKLEYRTILLDISNFKNDNFDIKDITTEIFLMLKNLNIKKAHFIAHGFTGAIINLFQKYYEDLVLSSTFITAPWIKSIPRQYYRFVEIIKNNECNTKEFGQVIRELYFSQENDPSIWLDNWNYDLIKKYMIALSRISQDELLNYMSHSQLIIEGKNNRFLQVEHNLINSIFKNEINITIIDNAAYEILHEQPNKMLQTITQFIKEVTKEQVSKKFYDKTFDLKKCFQNRKIDKMESYNFGFKPEKIRSFEEYGNFLIPYIKDGMKILDCGCGIGTMTMEIANFNKKGKVVGIDYDKEQIKIAKSKSKEENLENVEFIQTNVYELPFDNSSFDCVWMNMLLMHVKNQLEAIKEAVRVLKPGGILAVSDLDSDGNIMAPNYQIISQRMNINERMINKNSSDMRYGKNNSLLLNEVGLKNVLPSVRIESWGNKANVNDFVDLMKTTESIFFSNDASKMAINMRDESWNEWKTYPGAFFARQHFRAIGWKSSN